MMDHRRFIGGAWDEIGQLQFDFLVANGLKPDHRLLDYGCGSGRGAVKFVPYLNAGNYLGVDINQALLDSAIVETHEWANKIAHFLRVDQLTSRAKVFDYAICQSVFTHCNAAQIAEIMKDIDTMLKPDGVFYATWFMTTESCFMHEVKHIPGNRVTYHDRDPYHQTLKFWQIQEWAQDWSIEFVSGTRWEHPRGQRMLEMRRW